MTKGRLLKLLVVFAIFGMFASAMYSASYPIITKRGLNSRGWIIRATDDDIDGSAELLTKLDTTYAQLLAADTIYMVSASAADTTQTGWVSGVTSRGDYVTDSFTLDGTTRVTSTNTFIYVDQTWVSAECEGTISIGRTTGLTFINSIAVGDLDGDIAQHFGGDKTSYIQAWWATSNTADAVALELRWYPDDADCLDTPDGYRVLDRIYMAAGVYRSGVQVFSSDPGSGIRLGSGGWISVWGTGGIANQEASVTVVGFDRGR